METAGLIESYIQKAVSLQRGGAYDQAIGWCCKALDQRPDDADLLHFMGTLEIDNGQPGRAVTLLQRAIALEAGRAIYYKSLGDAHQKMKSPSRAIACYENAIRTDSKYVPAYVALFRTLTDKGRADEAEKTIKRLFAERPDCPEAYLLIGQAHLYQGRLKTARSFLKKACELNPPTSGAHFYLAVAYQKSHDDEKAMASYQKALQVDPHMPDAHNNIGLIYKSRHQFDKAIYHFEKAFASDPMQWECGNNLGNVYQDLGEFDNALECYRSVLQMSPENTHALQNMGNVYLRFAEYQTAMGYFRKALSIDPTCSQVRFNLGLAYQNMKDPEKAIACFQKVIEINPYHHKAKCFLFHQLQAACQWDRMDTLSREIDDATRAALLNGQTPAEGPFLNLIRHADPPLNYSIARSCSETLIRKMAVYRTRFEFNRDRKKKITIGYLSNRFRNAATAHLTLGVYGSHDRNHFNINCYSYGKDDGSIYRRRIENECDRFVDIRSVGHLQAAQRIHADQVDILVDLKGYTRANRLEIFALRPAPVQVSYLGFTGSTGADFIDYMVTDSVVTPEAEQSWYSEKFICMPHSYMVNDGNKPIGRQGWTRKDFGLPEHGFVFCNFNQPYKMEPAIFDTWMQVLKDLPGSVLWLLDGNHLYRRNIISEAMKRDVAAERLIFTPPLPIEKHLARYHLADLALDTGTYNGHTTTGDALWAGLPVLTIAGRHFMSRVSASLLSAIGMTELIAADRNEYRSIAVGLANDPAGYKAVRETLLKNRLEKPLFDTGRFVRNLETAYRMIWDRYLSGEKPAPIRVPDQG